MICRDLCVAALTMVLASLPLAPAAAQCPAEGKPIVKVHVTVFCSDTPPTAKAGEKLDPMFAIQARPIKVNETESCVPFYLYGYVSETYSRIRIPTLNTMFTEQCFELVSYSARKSNHTYTWMQFDENDQTTHRDPSLAVAKWSDLRVFVVAHIFAKNPKNPGGFSSGALMKGCPKDPKERAQDTDPSRCDRSLDGIVITAKSMENFTFYHEVGHWLGLFHVFKDSCGPGKPGDRVPDTPGELEAEGVTEGGENGELCPDPKTIRTCESDDKPAKLDNPLAKALVSNVMEYTSCKGWTPLTPGQLQRVRERFKLRQQMGPEDVPPDPHENP